MAEFYNSDLYVPAEELLKNNEEEFKKEVKRFTDIVLQFKNG